ncbi:MAG: hypothetical protein WC284_04435 [Candidimonas sp.]
MQLTINGKIVNFDDSDVIGKGLEATIYKWENKAVKVYKLPSHIDYANSTDEQKSAADRLSSRYEKLSAAPNFKSKFIIAPSDIVYANNQFIGFTMPMVKNSHEIMFLSEKIHRIGKSVSDIAKIFQNLHDQIKVAHSNSTIIGDFNDLNVMYNNQNEVFLIDVDSWQWGKWICTTYTDKFVDPLICSGGIPSKPHTMMTDWYAYTIMLMQSLLMVGPYGGVHNPTHGKKLTSTERQSQRVTVFDNSVKYPKPALPLSSIPSDVVDYLKDVFINDKRGPFPYDLLIKIEMFDPTVTTAVVKSITKDKLVITDIISGDGIIVAIDVSDNPLWLVWKNNAYYRENGDKVFDGSYDPSIKFFLNGKETVLIKDENVITVNNGKIDKKIIQDKTAIFNKTLFWTDNNRLLKMDGNLNRHIGNVISNQTTLWANNGKIAGVYRYGKGMNAFYDNGKSIITIPLPPMSSVIDIDCAIGDVPFFFFKTRQGPSVINICYAIDGENIITHKAIDNSDDWMGTIHGKCAVKNILLCPTDKGIIKVQLNSNSLDVIHHFVSTMDIVDGTSRLMIGKHGLYSWKTDQLIRLEMR